MYVCKCECRYVDMYVRMCVCILWSEKLNYHRQRKCARWVNTLTHTLIYTQTYIHVHTYIHTYTHKHIYTHLYKHTILHIHTYIHTLTYTHISIHNTYIYTQVWVLYLKRLKIYIKLYGKLSKKPSSIKLPIEVISYLYVCWCLCVYWWSRRGEGALCKCVWRGRGMYK